MDEVPGASLASSSEELRALVLTFATRQKGQEETPACQPGTLGGVQAVSDVDWSEGFGKSTSHKTGSTCEG